MAELGKVIEVKSKSGRMVQRKCVAVIEPKFVEEQKELAKKNGFAPVFVKDGAVWLSMTPAERKRVSPEEKARREKEAKADSLRVAKKRLASATKSRDKAKPDSLAREIAELRVSKHEERVKELSG